MQLIIAALVGILTIVLLIAVAKLHPFISLMVGSFVMAICAGVPYDKAFSSFTTGAGSTFSGVGLLVAFGAIIGGTAPLNMPFRPCMRIVISMVAASSGLVAGCRCRQDAGLQFDH